MGRPGTPATHASVHELAAALSLDEAGYRHAVELARLRPARAAWLRYLDRFLTAVGALLVIAGIAAFFAWNWAGLHHMAKFALIQGGIVACVLLAWRLCIDSTGGRASLFAAAFLVGILFAVFGQVYPDRRRSLRPVPDLGDPHPAVGAGRTAVGIVAPVCRFAESHADHVLDAGAASAGWLVADFAVAGPAGVARHDRG